MFLRLRNGLLLHSFYSDYSNYSDSICNHMNIQDVGHTARAAEAVGRTGLSFLLERPPAFLVGETLTLAKEPEA
jgi:hypothetical protein